MIITKTPVRISFLGGGTDYPDSIKRWGGITLGTTIDKYSYITVRRLPQFFDYNVRLMYSEIETVCRTEEVKHNVIRECLKLAGISKDVEISHMSDLPSNSGTGSSSTFTVGLINALYKLSHHALLPADLYYKALEVEQEKLGECVGCQDQAWAAFGGLNAFKFLPSKRLEVQKYYLSGSERYSLFNTLMLFYTKIPRSSSAIASSYVPTLSERESEHHELMKLACEGIAVMNKKDYNALGKLMSESWKVKKSLSKQVTNPAIDNIYDLAIDAGANGGKLMGAGGGGCLVLSVPVHRRQYVIDAIGDKALHIDFNFEPNGSQVIYG